MLSFNNGDLIQKIGDTEASHFDPFWHPYVVMLEALSSGKAGSEASMLIQYLCDVSETALSLSKRLFQSYASRESL